MHKASFLAQDRQLSVLYTQITLHSRQHSN